MRKMRKYFIGKFRQDYWIIIPPGSRCTKAWLQRAFRDRQQKLAEEETRYRVVVVRYQPLRSFASCLLSFQRTMRTALTIWTNRVIELKLRELEVGQQNTAALLT
jgi:protein SFI1